MPCKYLQRLTGLTLVVSLSFNACRTPVENRPNSKYFSDINSIQADGTGHKILAVGSFANVVLTTSSIFFIKDYSTLFSINYDGSNLTPLYQSLIWFDCNLAANGTKLLLTSRSSNSPLGANNLYLMNSDGSNLQQLTLTMGEFGLAQISPSLDEILFERKSGIAIANSDGSNVQFIRSQTDTSGAGSPRYLDENHILYYEINHNNGSESARLFDKTNHTDKLIVAHSGLSSPYTGKVLQGDSLLCLNGDFATIFVYTSDTLIEVARGYDATFSADGKKIVYHDLTHIFLQNIDGTNIQLVYTEQDQNKTVELPQLSPDGKFIIFQTLYSVPTN